MLRLGEIRATQGATKQRKRLGRGQGSGLGQTAGKGSKGQLQRTGGKVRRGFEGGQMPLYRRLPKKGFTNIFRVDFLVVNLRDLANVASNEIDIVSLKKCGILKGKASKLKVLGGGELSKPLVIKATAFTASALKKIEKAGGQAVTL
jgi:large subunit ribosomal protein L15